MKKLKFIIEPKYNEGETLYFLSATGISTGEVEALHCLMRMDGTHTVFYAIKLKETYYGKPKQKLMEEAILFRTPEEVGEWMVKDFASKKPVKPTNDSA